MARTQSAFALVLLALCAVQFASAQNTLSAWVTKYEDKWGITSALKGVELKDLQNFDNSTFLTLNIGTQDQQPSTLIGSGVSLGNVSTTPTPSPTTTPTPSPNTTASPTPSPVVNQTSPSPAPPQSRKYEAYFSIKVSKELDLSLDQLELKTLFNTENTPSTLGWVFSIQGTNTSSPFLPVFQKQMGDTTRGWRTLQRPVPPELKWDSSKHVVTLKIESDSSVNTHRFNASLAYVELIVKLPAGPAQTCPASCSGHGVCNTKTGICQCNAGYTPPLCLKESYAPAPGATWQIQLTGGNVSSCYDVDIYVLDALMLRAADIQAIQATERKVMCYIDFGVYDRRWDSVKVNNAAPPTIAAADIGKNYTGFNPRGASMQWLNIKSQNLRQRFQFMLNYVDELGCDGVVAAHLDAWRPAGLNTPAPSPSISPTPNITSTPTPAASPSPAVNKTSPTPTATATPTATPNTTSLLSSSTRLTAAAQASPAADPADPYATKTTGFSITNADQLAFNKYIAGQIRARNNMTAGIVNNPDQAAALTGTFLFQVAINCITTENCDPKSYEPWVSANKAVLGVETNGGEGQTCDLAAKYSYDYIRKDGKLGAEPFSSCVQGQIGSGCDKTGPRAGTIQGTLARHSATVWWDAFQDDLSRIYSYSWGIARQQNEVPDVLPWRSVGTATNVTWNDPKVRLFSDTDYFLLVRATNRVGMSLVHSSDPIQTSGGSITVGVGNQTDSFGIKDAEGKTVEIEIDIPAGAIPVGTRLDLSAAPPAGGFADPTAENNSTMKFAGVTFSIVAHAPNGTRYRNMKFNKPIGLDVGLPGTVKAGDVDTLALNYYDTVEKEWKAAACGSPRLPIGADSTPKSVPVYICHLTQFGLFYEGTADHPVNGKNMTWIYVVLGIAGTGLLAVISWFLCCRNKADRHDDFDQL